jgi:hypothetical protein
MLINFHVHQICMFSQSERLLPSNQKCLSRKKRHLSKVIKIACYSCQIVKLIIVFLITLL